MTLNEILESSPAVIGELTRELVRRGDEAFRSGEKSQETACFFLAIRAASLLVGMAKVLTPQTRDSQEVLLRAFLVARDLLLTFRFDHNGIRTKIGYWFAGKMDNSWKAEHKKSEEFFERLGLGATEFGERWSAITTLSHPTVYAATNSVGAATLWAASPPRVEDFTAMMEPKIADYLTSISTLIVIVTVDFPGLISLGCDMGRMPGADTFRDNVREVVLPILAGTEKGDLPDGSFRKT